MEVIHWRPGAGTKDPLDGRPYYATFEDFTLARYRVAGVWHYGLSRSKVAIGYFTTAQGASDAVRKIKREG